MRDTMDRLIVPIFRQCSIGELLIVAILAGVCEELLFRGALQNGLEQLSGRPWLALAVASLLFGLAHPITPLYAVLAGAIGVYLGWLMSFTGDLLAPIVAHAAYDFVALVYAVVIVGPKSVDQTGNKPPPANELPAAMATVDT